RSYWMLADFYGRVLIPLTPVEHSRSGFDTAIAALRRAIAEHDRRDTIVAVEQTGRYHRPLKRAFPAPRPPTPAAPPPICPPAPAPGHPARPPPAAAPRWGRPPPPPRSTASGCGAPPPPRPFRRCSSGPAIAATWSPRRRCSAARSSSTSRPACPATHD